MDAQNARRKLSSYLHQPRVYIMWKIAGFQRIVTVFRPGLRRLSVRIFKHTNHHRADFNGASGHGAAEIRTRASHFIVELSSRRAQPARGSPIWYRAFSWTRERVMYLRDPTVVAPIPTPDVRILTCELEARSCPQSL